jgi:hypothetical protein
VEAAVPAAEHEIGEEAAPTPADEGLGVIWWDSEEDLLDELSHQFQWHHGTR